MGLHGRQPPDPADGAPIEAWFGFYATRIQSWWRMMRVIIRLQKESILLPAQDGNPDRSARVIQRAWRKHHVDNQAPPEPIGPSDSYILNNWRYDEANRPRHHRCAHAIQRCWRSYLNRRIFKYYANLIRFREMGDPSTMLRSINPREAGLLDAAAGIHLRFRLGGLDFPPVIYYKIYTHHPLIDINAFAPRDYVKQKSLQPKHRHNKGPIPQAEKVGWYQRIENNGWRPVSKKLLLELDPVTASTAQKPVVYTHHSRLKRKEELIKRRKRKKIDWLRKIYVQTKQPGGDKDKANLDDDATEASSVSMDWEAEADDLLQWTENLDYEKYFANWLTLATSGKSDKSATGLAALDRDGLEAYLQAYADLRDDDDDDDDGGGDSDDDDADYDAQYQKAYQDAALLKGGGKDHGKEGAYGSIPEGLEKEPYYPGGHDFEGDSEDEHSPDFGWDDN